MHVDVARHRDTVTVVHKRLLPRLTMAHMHFDEFQNALLIVDEFNEV